MKTHRTLFNIAFAIFGNSVYTLLLKSWLTLGSVILTTPVVQGCSSHEHPQDSDFTEAHSMSSVKLAVRQTEETKIRSLDAFVFNDDALQRIDCYQRLDEIAGNELLIASCGGGKIVLLCANAPWENKGWHDVSSLQKASTMKVNLEDEDKEYPTMSAVIRMDAGSQADISLERLTSTIELRSIRCDFTGRTYEGESITEAKAYLTNVNGTCRIAPADDEPIERIINHGSLIPEDMTIFKNFGILKDSLGTIDISLYFPGTRLLCYPNTSSEESIGTPFTRLVIEGKIQGETWYWPININRDSGSTHEGIERNRRYVYDITIRSKGTKDPDSPIKPEMAETIFKTEKWKEKEPYFVAF